MTAVRRTPAHNFRIICVCLGYLVSKLCMWRFAQHVCPHVKQKRSFLCAALSCLPGCRSSPLSPSYDDSWVSGGFAMLLRSLSDIIILNCEKSCMRLSDSIAPHIPPAVFGLADWATSFTWSPNCQLKKHFTSSNILNVPGLFPSQVPKLIDLRGFSYNNHRFALKLSCLVKFPFSILLFNTTPTNNQTFHDYVVANANSWGATLKLACFSSFYTSIMNNYVVKSYITLLIEHFLQIIWK